MSAYPIVPFVDLLSMATMVASAKGSVMLSFSNGPKNMYRYRQAKANALTAASALCQPLNFLIVARREERARDTYIEVRAPIASK